MKLLTLTFMVIILLFVSLLTLTVFPTINAGLGDEILDQSQEESPNSSYVRETIWSGQGYTPTVDYQTKIMVKANRWETPSDDCYLEIRTDDGLGKPSSTIIVSMNLSYDNFSTFPSSSWIEFDHEDFEVTKEKYHIVLSSPSSDSENYYNWYYSTNNPYDGGVYTYSSDSGSSWTKVDAFDFAFKTYGYNLTETLDQAQETWEYGIDIYENKWKAQNYTATPTLFIQSKVELYIRNYYSPYPITAEIRTENGTGYPDMTEGGLVATATVPYYSFHEDYTNFLWIEFNHEDFEVTEEQYFICVWTAEPHEAPAYKRYMWKGITDSVYPNSVEFYSDDNASTWIMNEDVDTTFRIYGYTTTDYITLETDPVGLQVRMDEGAWHDSPHTFEFIRGTSHSIECNPIQSGGTRTQYLFQSWNDSGANPHSVSPTGNATYVATYKTQYQAYIQSYPEGSGYVEFDGSPITTPYTSGWFDSGLNRSVEATNVTVTANQERYNWSSWSDGKAISHNITIDGEAYVAYFSHEWFFKVNSIYDSPTGQEWYSDGDSTVNSTVTSPSSGYDVTGWVGTGSLTSGDTGESNTTGTFSIAEYSTCTWLWSCGPTFDSFSVSDNSIKSYRVFTISTVLSLPTGTTNFVNATVGISHDVILLWENATNTFSISYDPNSYVTLHAGSTKTVLSSTSIRLTWELSLNEEFPYGGVSVIEANTKVYDSTDLMDSGSYANLFIFQEDAGKGGGLPFVSPTMPSAKQFVEDIVSPTIFSLASNLVTVLLLATVGLSCVIAYHMEHPVWKILAGVFAVLGSNFFLLFVLLPTYPSGLSFLEPYLLRLPALELSTYPLGTQSLLQFIVVGALIPAFIIPIMLVAYRNE